MSKLIDMTGKKFGRLTVTSRGENRNSRKDSYWNCICDCGNEAIVSGYKLRTGHTQSCGCLHSEVCADMLRTHGYSDTPTHVSWRSMIQRCTDPNSTSYPNYGGRGIAICERWLTFENFLEDMGIRPDDCTLDRIDANGNYEPNNCKWSTISEQNNNTRGNRMVEVNNELVSMAEASRLTGVPYHVLFRRLEQNMSDAEAISKPVLRHKRNR